MRNYHQQVSHNLASWRYLTRITLSVILFLSGVIVRADPPCAITNAEQAFAIRSIVRDTNGHITLTWESCPNYLYEVQGSETLWAFDTRFGPVLMGNDGTTTCSNVFEGPDDWRYFYRVQRLSFDGDEDGDGLSNVDEYTHGANLRNLDSDYDGMWDGWEVRYGLNPTNYNDSLTSDLDGDGLSDPQEFHAGTDPRNPDTDGDEMPDMWEVMHDLNPIDPKDTYGDFDNDGYNNFQEYELRTWPKAFSSQPGYMPRNLVAWWKLDDGTGTNVSDASLNRHHGTVAGGNGNEVWTSGAFSNAVTLGGASNNWIQVPYRPGLVPVEELTLAGWVKPLGRGVLIGNWDSAAQLFGNFRLQFGPDHVELWFALTGSGSYESVRFNPNWSTNDWHHVAVRYGGDNLAVFVDGELTDSRTVVGPLSPVPNPIMIGVPGLVDAYPVDDVRIYNRALSTNEIASFSRGNGLPVEMIVGQTASLRAFAASEDCVCHWSIVSGRGFLTNTVNFTTDFRPSWTGAVTVQVVCASSGVIRTNFSRTSVRFPGLSALADWRSGQHDNNCYNFSTDMRTGTYAQPGRGGGAPAVYPPQDCQSEIEGAVADGLQAGVDLNDLCHTSGLPRGHIVALLVSPGFDYHFVRMEMDGTWSSKFGVGSATILDFLGQPIKDPRTANFGTFQFCGFLWAGPNIHIR